MEKREAREEIARWCVFLFVVVPLLPLEIFSFIVGTAWAVSKECFMAGACILNVWEDDKPEGGQAQKR
jgi:hypothetical protein